MFVDMLSYKKHKVAATDKRYFESSKLSRSLVHEKDFSFI